MGKPIKVMIVDDSAVVRQVLQQQLSADPGIEVIAVASDPIFAMNHLARVRPDVMILDVEMPRMDGITFLRKLMAENPLPVVICSTLTEKGAKTTFEALSAGAVCIVTKPKVGLKDFLLDATHDIISAVKAAARANVRNLGQQAAVCHTPVEFSAPPSALALTTDRVIAIGTSTGGTQALEAIFRALPANAPGIVAVQHMPEKFTAMFAERLNSVCAIRVKEAETGDRVIPGQALIAPGGRHLRLRRSGAQYRAEIFDGPLVNRHKPAVDVLFRSVAQCAGGNAVGFILTGMGDDGARGLLEMRQAGAATYAQDERSCVVFGMPKEAIQRGAAQTVIPLAAIARAITGYGG